MSLTTKKTCLWLSFKVWSAARWIPWIGKPKASTWWWWRHRTWEEWPLAAHPPPPSPSPSQTPTTTLLLLSEVRETARHSVIVSMLMEGKGHLHLDWLQQSIFFCPKGHMNCGFQKITSWMKRSVLWRWRTEIRSTTRSQSSVFQMTWAKCFMWNPTRTRMAP